MNKVHTCVELDQTYTHLEEVFCNTSCGHSEMPLAMFVVSPTNCENIKRTNMSRDAIGKGYFEFEICTIYVPSKHLLF